MKDLKALLLELIAEKDLYYRDQDLMLDLITKILTLMNESVLED